MAEAGYADGFEVTLTCASNNSEGLEWTTIAQKVQQDLAEIGITVKIETLETTLVYEKMREGTMPFYIMFWSPDYYDINNQTAAFLPGVGDDGTAYGNRSKWERTPENEILWTLANNPGMVFSREHLLQSIWGYDFLGDTRAVDSHIKRIRAKLCKEGNGWDIKTVWGVGYRFEIGE